MNNSLSYEESIRIGARPIAAPKPLDLTTLTLLDLEDVSWGFEHITFEEFERATDMIGAKHYAELGWPYFCRNSIRYCLNREQTAIGDKLIRLALQKAQARRAAR